MHRLIFFFLLIMQASITSSLAQDGAPARPSRVILVPLDDRPVCLQLPVLLGPIANAEVVTPPRPLLGRFTTGGDFAGISEWLESQSEADAVIVSLDMLAYGGLVASRVHLVDEETALARLQLVEEIRVRRPNVPIYGFSIIMRLAPTADGTNEPWRRALARWAELVSEIESNPAAAEEVLQLEATIPDPVLSNYKRARARNLAVNRAAIEMVQAGTIDYLILGQDDAKPKGIHVADRIALLGLVEDYGLEKKVTVQAGADEVAMLLLTRILTNRFHFSPSIRPIFSSELIRTSVAPYEDGPLHETVSRHIASAGARETTEEEADLLFYVFGSRHEEGITQPFANRIARDVQAGRRVIVADIDTRGDVQGSAREFTEALRQHNVFPHLFGYASWNTAGNTIGTALPHGILFALATERFIKGSEEKQRAREAQVTFLMQRLTSDYVYQSLVRPDINRNYFRERSLNPMQLSADETVHLEKAILERVLPLTEGIWKDFLETSFANYQPARLTGFKLALPWGRTFEAEFTFQTSGELID